MDLKPGCLPPCPSCLLIPPFISQCCLCPADARLSAWVVPSGAHRCLLCSSLPGHLDLAEPARPWGRTCSCSRAVVAASERPRSLLDGDLQHGQGFFPWGGCYFMPSAEPPSVALSVNLTPCPASQPMAKFLWVMLAPMNPLPRLSCCSAR